MIYHLQPCPWCRQSSQRMRHDSRYRLALECMHCFARGPTRDKLADAIAAWNARLAA